MWQKFLWIAAAGSLARYGLAGFVLRGGAFPWGTLALNVAGCFLFGVVWGLGVERQALWAELRSVVLIGFMGAFAPFSTFAFETGETVREGQYLLAVGNVGLQNIGGSWPSSWSMPSAARPARPPSVWA